MTLFPVSRTPETRLAVSLGAFLPSAKKSLVDDFPRHQRASTFSNCLTTARRASCVTSCAMLSAWTRASSSLNSSSSGQASQEGYVGLSKSRVWGSVYVEPARSEALNYRRVTKDSLTLFFKLGWAWLQLTPLHRSVVFLQHNPLFRISLCHFHSAVFNDLIEICL